MLAKSMRVTGMEADRPSSTAASREHAEAGRAMRVSGGRWRARTPEERYRE